MKTTLFLLSLVCSISSYAGVGVRGGTEELVQFNETVICFKGNDELKVVCTETSCNARILCEESGAVFEQFQENVNQK